MTAIRLLLFLILVLVTIEYLFNTVLELPVRTLTLSSIYVYKTADTTDKIIDEPDTTVSQYGSETTEAVKANQEENIKSRTTLPTSAGRVDAADIKALAELFYKMNTIQVHATKSMEIANEPTLPLCNETRRSEALGPVPVRKEPVLMKNLCKKFPEIQKGGRYNPSNCIAVHKVAIIVPYRDRAVHLPIFLNHMHGFLMKQRIEYGIFIVEQEGNSKFNRAKLFNVGFKEAQRLKAGGWHCFIFHDIDLLPMDTRNLYVCSNQPRHMSAYIDYYHFRLPYKRIFGGASALSLEQFKKVNGFSNKYWGWGGEDDDMFYRLKNEGYNITRYKRPISNYTSLPHGKSSTKNKKRYRLLSKTKGNRTSDEGLSTLNYTLVSLLQHHLYTHIRANIQKRRPERGILQDLVHQWRHWHLMGPNENPENLSGYTDFWI